MIEKSQQEEPKVEDSFDFPKYFITGFEYREVISEIGVSVREFAQHIGRSENFVRQGLGYRTYQFVPLRWVDALSKYVGLEIYTEALRKVRARKEMKSYYLQLKRLGMC